MAITRWLEAQCFSAHGLNANEISNRMYERSSSGTCRRATRGTCTMTVAIPDAKAIDNVAATVIVHVPRLLQGKYPRSYATQRMRRTYYWSPCAEKRCAGSSSVIATLARASCVASD